MLRERRRDGVPKELVEGLVSFKFVLGKSGREDWEEKLDEEESEWGDLVRLRVKENMDDGLSGCDKNETRADGRGWKGRES